RPSRRGTTSAGSALWRRNGTGPFGGRESLPGFFGAWLFGFIEIEEPRLLSGVGFQLQCVVIGPPPADSQRAAHDGAGSERFALVAGRIVFRKIPRVGDLFSFGVKRYVGIVAFRRGHHPPAPLFGDKRDPVPRDVDLRSGPRSRRRLRRSGLRL